MKVLLTGASGFLGKAMQEAWAGSMEVITLGRHENATIVCDLSTQKPILTLKVDMVVHAAGKAHIVPANEEDKKDFFDVNVQGTKNLLAALEQAPSVKKLVFISSVAVYGLTRANAVAEDAPLLATDPYGRSKIEAEKKIANWCQSRSIDYYILRLPLIAGINAPGNLGKMINGVKKGRYLSIGKAAAKKSMVWANDVAGLIANIDGPSGIYNLTDGYHPSFSELERKISTYYGKKLPPSLPMTMAKLVGYLGGILGPLSPINIDKINKITSTLTFDDSLARAKLKWRPHTILEKWEPV